MKKILMPVIAVIVTLLSANAQQGPIEISAGQFRNISLGDDMKVVLKVVEKVNADFTLNQKASEKLSFSFSGNALHIAPRKPMHDQTVYVLVNKLDVLSLGFNTEVITEGVLRGDWIDVFVSDNSNAKLNTTAKVKGHGTGGSDVKISSTTKLIDLSVSVR